MGNGDRPNGQLLAGAIGGFMTGGAFLIYLSLGAALISIVMGGRSTGLEGARAIGGLALLAAVLLLAGGICGGIGWLGYNKVKGGTSALAGTFSFLMVAFMVLLVISGIIGGEIFPKISTYGLLASIGLAGVLGGLGMMGGEGLAKIGGIILLIGGAATLVLLILAIINVDFAGFGEVILYTTLGGLGLGHVLSGVMMLGARA